ncbi:aminotransferase class III-fold pyridoxal phosphate-dependent enzyme [Microbacterium sp. 13-71-7]|uniref:aminotransferase class III-fold pyridoxal phosphate-dependent enzyme n=1 Tax=Microbacterium sp. 13-71-7 TaxID=1970399 RepID=UPI000BD7E26B|nr:aminotransferase class III-fold pyridoxal phosphate-dependent enzyme [Microbacterium sp. 13-71-7]OZB81877.1 MAG: ornithine--oxo-acid transaminase [Microbacterium sp. 13-71-7]
MTPEQVREFAEHGTIAGQDPDAGTEPHVARNYAPLDVTIARGEGAWVTDVEGKRYLDLLAAYSAVNFGHRHPALVAALEEQLGRVALTSRAFRNDRLEPFAAALARLCGKDLVLPMNTGAEAVETGIKVARAWGYRVKGVRPDAARIVVGHGNFHGRTTTIVGFSDDESARDGFGPFTPGFDAVPYGDAEAIAAAITEDTVAVLIEPIQGESGVVIPPEGFLRRVREICDERNVLFIADEIQSGLGRVGETFACDREGVVPDLYLLGKALGGALGGFTTGPAEVIEMLRQRSRPYLFSNSLPPHVVAAAIKVFDMLESAGELRTRVQENTAYFRERMTAAGFDIKPGVHPIVPVMIYDAPKAQAMASALLEEGIYVTGFFYPVVPQGQARIRTQMSAAHTREHLDRAIDAFTRIGKQLGVIG